MAAEILSERKRLFLRRRRIQKTMETRLTPPERRTSFPSPMMVYVIVGIIVAVFVLFLAFCPS